ncbi:unnamed protein product [Cylicocyclus nassatus]|uniref:Carboxylesterase type B domain-containing protein n=1 Tax=Cylicocyclus nassatus TaxID=53992 RepID=A0AA36GCQ5_CYLNA|nr:unnamed protein product [Cylicocyclus nassatus]
MITLLLIVALSQLSSTAPILELTPGKVQGFEHQTKQNATVEVFLNIPYAAPPVDELRFERPKAVTPWADVRSGEKFGPQCLQLVQMENTSEDCLTLNIIRPRIEGQSTSLPILFWVHGGGYELGSATQFGYEGFANIYASKGIIVVSIQYRLGVFGFFSTGDERISGNLGLFDMAEALKFIYTNAENIGGDWTRITVWGHSAGSAATGQLALSQLTREYIAQTIEMSGSPWGSWAIGAGVAHNSFELAEALGCEADIKACLKKKTVNEIYEAVDKVEFIRLVYVGDRLEDFTGDIVSFYVDRDEEPKSEFYINRYTEFVSNLLFEAAIVDDIQSRQKAGWTVYAYMLDYYNDAIWRDVPKALRGAPHASEYPYVHGINVLSPFEFNEDDRTVANFFRESLVEFIKTGILSHHNKSWLNISSDPNIRYTQITPHPQTNTGFFNLTAAFWQRMRLYDYDMVQLLPRNKRKAAYSQWLYVPMLQSPQACLILWIIGFCSSAQVLELKPGKILGFTYKTKSGRIAEIFLNIPYASPPVDELRFEKPTPVKPWKNIRNGTALGPACHPVLPGVGFTNVPSSEDCLTLNIIRPKKEKQPESPRSPILIWIHGGGGQFGSAHDFGYEDFADIYIPNDVVVVIIQYRLGVYGFFSTGDQRMPGNLGLWDMAEAVKFVHSNAKSIGGDASRITVWGHSSGGAAAGQLILSPVTRDYVAQSIEMSGSPWAAYAIGAFVATNSLALAEKLQCGDDIRTCLKGKSAEEINEGIRQLVSTSRTFFQKIINLLLWLSVKWYENDEMVASAKPKASIIGMTNKEATAFTLLAAAANFHKFFVDPQDYSIWNRGKLINELKKLMRSVYNGEYQENLINDIVSFYIDRGEKKNPEFYIDRFAEFISDVNFNVPAVNGILSRLRTDWKLYAYTLDYYNDALFQDEVPNKLRGAPHGSELPYANGGNYFEKFEHDANDRVVAGVFQQSFATFAKTGTPMNDREVWLDVGTDPDLRYLSISDKTKMKTGFFGESTSFWNKTREYGFDMLQVLPATFSQGKKEEL